LEYWRWLALAAAIGFLVTVVAARGERQTRAHFLAPLFALFILAALLLAVIAPPLAGRLALYHETALLIFAAYLLGGIVGLNFGRTVPFAYTAWWVGLASVAFVWVESNVLVTPNIEKDLNARVAIAVERAGGDPLDLEIAGRDVLLLARAGNEEQRAALSNLIGALPGVRTVSEVPKLTGAAAERRENALSELAARKAAEEADAEAAVEKALEDVAAKIAATKAAHEAAARAAAEKAAQEAAAKAEIDKALSDVAAKIATAKAEREAAEVAAESAAREAAANAEVNRALREITEKISAAKTAAAAKIASDNAAVQDALGKAAAERATRQAAAAPTPTSAEMTVR
jgi:hypothetical protein